jgi:hypothetical protein
MPDLRARVIGRYAALMAVTIIVGGIALLAAHALLG